MEKNLLYDKSKELYLSVYKQVTENLKKERDNHLLAALLQELSSITVQLYSLREYSSTKSFVIKLYVARRGAVRAQCWVELLQELNTFTAEYCSEVTGVLTELVKMLSASIATMTKKKDEAMKEE